MAFETPDEEILFNLGKSSFLSIWSYSNLFRDQGDVNKNGDGKELCDFTVVFGNSILLFSDKRAEYRNIENETVAWNRWYKNTIRKSADQLNGAERWIKSYPERIFKDKRCRDNLGLLSSTNLSIHKIVVTHGLEEILEDRFGESSFSYTNKSESTYTINQQGVKPGFFFHTFTGDSLLFIISQINTTKDFIEYLEQRESAFSRSAELYVQKESDLVHFYFKSYNSVSKNQLDTVSQHRHPMCTYCDGIDGLLGDLYYVDKKKSDEISFFWDGLIEHFSEHAVDGTLVGPVGINLSETEVVLRRMAETSRLERRVLSEAVWEKWASTKIGQRGMRQIIWKKSNLLYVFLFLPGESFESNDAYREFRRNLVAEYAFIFGEENRNYAEVICFGFKTNWKEQTDISIEVIAAVILEGVDFCMMSNDNWTNEDVDKAGRIRSALIKDGLLTPKTRVYSGKRNREFLK